MQFIMSFSRPTRSSEGLVGCLSDLHLLSCLDYKRSANVRRPLGETLFSSLRPACLPEALVPGSWSPPLACGHSCLGFTLSPLLHLRSAKPGGAVFPPTREAVRARPRTAGPPGFGEPWSCIRFTLATLLRRWGLERNRGW